MAKVHRRRDIDGIITETPFTPEEEATSDQMEANATFFHSSPERIKRIVDGDDVRSVIFSMIFKLHNRVRVLEGKPTISVTQFLTFLEGELT